MAERIRVDVKGLVVDPATNVPMVILRATEGEGFVLPIWVGVFEANAIALQLEGIGTPRPMTHDLLRDVVAVLGAQVAGVVITDLRDSTFFATVELRDAEGRSVTVDARPSDALALALRVSAPVFIEASVIERAQSFDPGSQDPSKLREWFEDMPIDPLGHWDS